MPTQFHDRTFVSTDGLTLFARDYAAANGPAKLPVMCLHGLTRNSADFETFAAWITALGHRVLVLDMRGRGRSAYDTNPGHYQPIIYANDVIKLLQDLGIAQAIFVGTSMGGIIIMLLALRQLRLIKAAILNDVGPIIAPRGLNRLKLGLTNIANNYNPQQAINSWEEAANCVKNIHQAAFPNNTMLDWEKMAKRTFQKTASGQLILQYDPKITQVLLTPPPWYSLMMMKWAFKRLTRHCATLLIHGELSDILESKQVTYMRTAAPNMQYVQIPNVGHAPSLMETEAQTTIANFLIKL